MKYELIVSTAKPTLLTWQKESATLGTESVLRKEGNFVLSPSYLHITNTKE